MREAPLMPDEAVHEATQAYLCASTSGVVKPETLVRIVLEAAAPFLAAQARADERRKVAELIAAAIEARRCPAERKFCDSCVCRPEDAALARQIGEARDSG